MPYKLMKYLDPDGTKATEIPEAYLDGYGFGDRFLEGIAFRITTSGDGEVIASCPNPASQAYLKSCHVNMGSLLKEAAQAAIGTDCLATTADMQDDDAFLWDGKEDLGFQVMPAS